MPGLTADIITGRDGYVNGVPCVTMWGYNRNASVARYAASCSGYGTMTRSGNINETGSMSGIGGDPSQVLPGTTVSFKGVADNTVADAVAYDGTVLITQLEIDIPTEDAGNVSWTAQFGVQGELTPGTTGAADATFNRSEGAAICPAPILFNGGTPYPIPGYRKAKITLRMPEKPLVSGGLTYRRNGNLEADISIDVYSRNARNVKYDPNVIDKLKIFVNATEFWNFEWIQFSEQTGFVVKRDTQDLLGYTINGMWTCVNGTTAGHLTRPNGTHIFGT